MAAYQKFQSFVEQQLIAPCDFDANTFKFALSNTAPNLATADFFNDITEIVAGSGYTAGGFATALSVSRAAGVAKVTGTDVTITSTGTIGPFRYVIFYRDTGTPATSTLIAMWDNGASITLNNTEFVLLDTDAINGLFQLS